MQYFAKPPNIWGKKCVQTRLHCIVTHTFPSPDLLHVRIVLDGPVVASLALAGLHLRGEGGVVRDLGHGVAAGEVTPDGDRVAPRVRAAVRVHVVAPGGRGAPGGVAGAGAGDCKGKQEQTLFKRSVAGFGAGF